MADLERPDWAVRIQGLREQRRWSKPDLARALLEAAGHPSNDVRVRSLVSQVRRYERGKNFPREWTEAYCQVFGLGIDDLFPTSTIGASCTYEERDDDVRRRELLTLLATTAATLPFGAQTEQQRVALNEAIGSASTERDADVWERTAWRYAFEAGALPAAPLLQDLMTDLAELNLLIGHAQGHVKLRLTHAAAQLSALSAITLTNLGDVRGARRWWRTAARAADVSGDPAAASLVRGRLAVFSLYDDRSVPTVLRTADEAIEMSHGVACAGVASAYAAKAQALARFGRRQEAVRALDELRGEFVRLPDSVREDHLSQWGWSAQRLHHVESDVWTHVGDVDSANRAQDQALTVYPKRNYQGRAQIELHRAGCLLRVGDVEEGARHTVRVLQGIPAEHREDGLLRKAALAALALAPERDQNRPAIRDVRELLALEQGES